MSLESLLFTSENPAVNFIYYAELLLDVPLLVWALAEVPRRAWLTCGSSDLPRVRLARKAVCVLALVITTLAYCLLKLSLRNLAVAELPVVATLMALAMLATCQVRFVNALHLGILYVSFTSIVVSATFKMMDFWFGYDLVWAYLVSFSVQAMAKGLFAFYCRRRASAFLASEVLPTQAALAVLLWPVTVCVLAYNRPEVAGQLARFLGSPSAVCIVLCALALVVVLWDVEFTGYHAASRMVERLDWALASQRQVWEQKLAHDEQIRSLYHDLKHLRTILEGPADVSADVRAPLDAAFEALRYHEMQPGSGNATVDALVTRKAIEARDAGVELHAYLDLSRGDFVRDMDWLLMLGNALDNAVEAAAGVTDPEHRLVQAKASQVGGQLVVTVANWHEGELRMRAGRPATTKQDARHHGFGIPSIERCARGYGGWVDIEAQDGLFELCVTLPTPSSGRNPSKG